MTKNMMRIRKESEGARYGAGGKEWTPQMRKVLSIVFKGRGLKGRGLRVYT